MTMPDTITGTTSAAASLTASLTALLAEFGGLWQDGRGWWRSPFCPPPTAIAS